MDPTSHDYAAKSDPDFANRVSGQVHGEFHELVVVDRGANTLVLIVAADD